MLIFRIQCLFRRLLKVFQFGLNYLIIIFLSFTYILLLSKQINRFSSRQLRECFTGLHKRSFFKSSLLSGVLKLNVLEWSESFYYLYSFLTEKLLRNSFFHSFFSSSCLYGSVTYIFGRADVLPLSEAISHSSLLKGL